MGTFKDTAGQEWQLRLTAGLATRIREATGVPILLTSAGEGLAAWKGGELPHDPEKFVQALWLFVEKQAGQRGIDRAAFEDAFGGTVYQKATAAYFGAVQNFSPLPDVLREVMGTGEEMVNRLNSASKPAVMNSQGP